jgi:hypothetical protein
VNARIQTRRQRSEESKRLQLRSTLLGFEKKRRKHTLYVPVHTCGRALTDIPHQSSPRTPIKVIQANAALPTPIPVVAIVQRTQLRRSTRPPVRAEEHLGFPYTSYTPNICKPVNTSLPDITIDTPILHLPGSRPKADPDTRRRKLNRVRKAIAARQSVKHHSPSFWTSDVRRGGRSLGYGFGYPGSPRGGKYQRDKMKSGVHGSLIRR